MAECFLTKPNKLKPITEPYSKSDLDSSNPKKIIGVYSAYCSLGQGHKSRVSM